MPRTIKATWGFAAQHHQQHPEQQQQQQHDPAASVAEGPQREAWDAGDCSRVDPLVLRDVVKAAVPFVEGIAARRAGGAPVQVRDRRA